MSVPQPRANCGCSLTAALRVVGERWSILVLHSIFNGLHHFEDIQAELGIARNVLADRLACLVEHGVLTREALAHNRRRIRYALTLKGNGLLPMLLALRQWGDMWNAGGPNPLVLRNRQEAVTVNPAARSSSMSRDDA